MADALPATVEDWSAAKDKIRDMLGELRTFDDIAKELKPAPQHVVKRLFDEVLLEHAHQIESPTNLDDLMRLKARHSFKLEAIGDLAVLNYKRSCENPKRKSGRPILLNIAIRAFGEQRRIWGADAPERHETRIVNTKPEVDRSVQAELLSDPELQRLALEQARREHEIRCARSDADRLRSKGVWGQLGLSASSIPPDWSADGGDGGETEETDGLGSTSARQE